GNGTGGFKAGGGAVIGNNWSAFNMIIAPGDFDGDGNPDLIGRNISTGDLQFYGGNGAGGFKAGGGAVIGNNRTGFNAIVAPGAFDGDGNADLIARNPSTGDLQSYGGNGAGGFKAGGGAVVGSNWTSFDILF